MYSQIEQESQPHANLRDNLRAQARKCALVEIQVILRGQRRQKQHYHPARQL